MHFNDFKDPPAAASNMFLDWCWSPWRKR